MSKVIVFILGIVLSVFLLSFDLTTQDIDIVVLEWITKVFLGAGVWLWVGWFVLLRDSEREEEWRCIKR